jgi:hypothetical protein
VILDLPKDYDGRPKRGEHEEGEEDGGDWEIWNEFRYAANLSCEDGIWWLKDVSIARD